MTSRTSVTPPTELGGVDNEGGVGVSAGEANIATGKAGELGGLQTLDQDVTFEAF